MKPTLFLLAAGMGSRYGGLKQLDGLGPNGETIMDYSIYDAIRAGFGKIVFVIRKDFEEQFRTQILSKYEGKIPAELVFQSLDALPEGFTCPEGRVKPWGTNHAVLMGKDVIKEPFCVINCDDFYGRDAFANIGKFLNDVYALVESKKTTDIVDISNQSSKEGIRIVLELRKGADTQNLINLLYKKTKLEDTFGVNMLAVADGRPETLSLKQVIEHHVDFVFDVTTRKYTTLLNKEQEKKEIQEGLIKACDVIDLIIEILRGSKNREQVKKCLVDGVTEGIRFKSKSSEKAAQKLHFSEKQAAAILDMRLYKLIGLEIEALQADYAETMKNISVYEDILNNYDSMAEVIMKELDQIKKEYGTKRRTVIENAEEVV